MWLPVPFPSLSSSSVPSFLSLFVLLGTFHIVVGHDPLNYKSCDLTSSDGLSCQICDEGHYCPVSTHGEVSRHPCTPGHYCKHGIQIKCPAGRYSRGQMHLQLQHNDANNDTISSDEQCDGLCLPGYYCPKGSSSPTQHQCGNRTVYCPLGSASPIQVSKGYYSYNATIIHPYDDESTYNATMSWQKMCEVGYYCEGGVKHPCPAGTYGDRTGMSLVEDCQPCKRGYYCPSDSINTNAREVPCGSVEYYCPDGSGSPIPVDIGYYSTGGEGFDAPPGSPIEVEGGRYRMRQELCPRGHYCQGGVKHSCQKGVYGNETGLHDTFCSNFCPPGYYCPEGTVEPIPCPANSFSVEGWSECVFCDSKLQEGRIRCQTGRNCCNQRMDGTGTSGQRSGK